MDEQQRQPPQGPNDHISEGTAESPLRPEIVDHPNHGGGDDGHRYHANYDQSVRVMSIESSALAAFGLAVASWFLIPIVGAIAALFVASGAKRRIRHAEEGTVAGRTLATAAQAIAWANILLFAFVAWLIVSLLRWIF